MKVLRLILAEPEALIHKQPPEGISGFGGRVESPEDIVEMSMTLGRMLANTARMYPWELPVTAWTLDRKK